MKRQTDPVKLAKPELGAKRDSATSRSLLQVRLSQKAGENLQRLVASTGIRNRTHLVNAAIDLAADIIGTIQKGGSIVYEHPDGSRERLKVVGV